GYLALPNRRPNLIAAATLGVRCVRARCLAVRNLLQYRVFKGLRGAQAHYRLGLDLDGLTGLRIAAHARLAVRFYGAADVWDDELAGAALAFSYGELEKLFKEKYRRLFRSAALLGDVRHNLGLAHWLSCHLVFLSS